MAKITRTMRINGSRRLLGQLLRGLIFTASTVLLLTGILRKDHALTITGTLLLLTIFIVWRLRRSITVTLTSSGILFSCVFWRRYYAWEEVKAAGVYYVENSHVIFCDPSRTIPAKRLNIYVSDLYGYFPRRYDRFNNRRSMHFKWNRDAWAVIGSHIAPHIQTNRQG